MKHTPWRISYETTPGEFVTDEKIRDSHEGVIATLHADSKVNGPLLCAAPELLEALEMLLSRVISDQEALNSDYGPSGREIIEQARAAIRKAKGEA